MKSRKIAGKQRSIDNIGADPNIEAKTKDKTMDVFFQKEWQICEYYL